MYIKMPYPISTNNLFPTNRYGRRYKSKRYTDWRKKAVAMILDQNPERVDGRFHIEVNIERKKTKKGYFSKVHPDLDNTVKAYLDILESMNLIENDRLAMSIRLRWCEYVEGAMVLVFADRVSKKTE